MIHIIFAVKSVAKVNTYILGLLKNVSLRLLALFCVLIMFRLICYKFLGMFRVKRVQQDIQLPIEVQSIAPSIVPEIIITFVTIESTPVQTHVLSTTALPYKFITPLEDTTSPLGDTVTLACKVSKKGAKIAWYRHGKKLDRSKAVEIVSEGLVQKLIIHDTQRVDATEYTCTLKKGDERDETKASLTLEGNSIYFVYLFLAYKI